MTRIVYKLAQRGWVKKERRGRTNRLSWIRGTAEEKKSAKAFEDRHSKQTQKKVAEKLLDGNM
jgi:hypothetical protein